MRIIGYSSRDKALVISPGPQSVDISGEVALLLGKRGCVGKWEGEVHVPCDSDSAPVCDRCGAGAVDPCVMCRGVCRKPEKTCLQEHSVYLAAFAPDLIKVGVSKAFRLEKRLAEQGADAGFEIARLPDGEAARQMEAGLRSQYPDRMAFEDKLAPGQVDGAIDTISKNYQIIRSVRFRHFSRELWMQPIVIKLQEGMAISGTTVGIKGQALVIEKLGTLYGLNLDSLAGYDCEIKKGRASLQSSLFTY